MISIQGEKKTLKKAKTYYFNKLDNFLELQDIKKSSKQIILEKWNLYYDERCELGYIEVLPFVQKMIDELKENITNDIPKIDQ